MSNIRISFFNFKSMIKTRGFLFSLSIAIMYLLLWLYIKPKAFIESDYQFEFFRIINFILIYYSCVALGKDFTYGTSKALFTAPLSRNSILVQKLMVVLQIGLLYWLCSRVLYIGIVLRMTKTIDINSVVNINMFKSLIIYLLISFVFGAFGLMVSSVMVNFNKALVIAMGYFGVLQYFIPLFYYLTIKPELTFSEKIITSTPNYILFYWVEYWNIRGKDVFIMMLWGSIFFIISLIVINKRNIK